MSYEDNVQTISASKIGLMYASDFYYAYDITGATKCFGNESCLNWLVDTSNSMWTMTNSGLSTNNKYYGWGLGYDYIGLNNLSNTFYFRPVFYLNSDVQYTGQGDGSELSPFEIA